jgi:anti-sigma regulatory factor (Ser/Thr protein kinase)
MVLMTVRRPVAGRHHFQRNVLASPSAVGLLRDLVTIHLNKWGLDTLDDDARLIVSEIATNAVNASPCQMIRMEMFTLPGALVLEIWDPSPRPPARRQAGMRDTGGRGLEIVDFLADGWGHRWPPEGGKIVYALLKAGVA